MANEGAMGSEFGSMRFTSLETAVAQMRKMFECGKCKHLPKTVVYRLSGCSHTFCDTCVVVGKKTTCSVCGKLGILKLDSYVSAIADQLTNLNLLLEQEKQLTKENVNTSASGSDEEELFAMDLSCNKTVIDNTLNEEADKETEDKPFSQKGITYDKNEEFCTPNGGISSPDVLEETPHEKTMFKRSIKRLTGQKRKLFGENTVANREPEENIVTVNKETGDEDFIEQSGIPLLTPHTPQHRRKTGLGFNAVPKNTKSPESVISTLRSVNADCGNQSFDEPLPCLTPYTTRETVPNVRVKGTSPIAAVNTEPVKTTTKRRPRKSSKSNSEGNIATSKEVASSVASVPSTVCATGSKNPTERQKLVAKRSLSSKRISVVETTNAILKTPSAAVEISPHPEQKAKERASKKLNKQGDLKNLGALEPSTTISSNDSSGEPVDFNPLATSTPTMEVSFTTGKEKQKRNAKGETRLHIACRLGSKEKVIQLLNEGSDVNAKDHANWTPLHDLVNGTGSLESKLEIIDLLNKEGCFLNAVGGDQDETALHKAVVLGSEPICSKLLLLDANPNILDRQGRTAKFYAKEGILHLFEHVVSYVLPENRTYNFERFVIYFSKGVSNDIIKSATTLNLKFSKLLTQEVTHIVYPVSTTDLWVPKSIDYIFGIAHRMWHVSCDWITESVKNRSCLNPTDFEVQGCYVRPSQKGLERKNIGRPGIPRLCRVSVEDGNPGLLIGFNIYLYKDCTYESITKSILSFLIHAAGGKTTNRQPNPDSIDPMEYFGQRFHANNDASPFVMTSHVILYSKNWTPPESKMFKLGHVKTLPVKWLIDSLLEFTLLNPQHYENDD